MSRVKLQNKGSRQREKICSPHTDEYKLQIKQRQVSSEDDLESQNVSELAIVSMSAL